MADGNITVEVSTQAAEAELERLRAALRAVLQTNVGRQTLAQLADGMATSTDEGHAWLAAAEMVLGPNVRGEAPAAHRTTE